MDFLVIAFIDKHSIIPAVISVLVKIVTTSKRITVCFNIWIIFTKDLFVGIEFPLGIIWARKGNSLTVFIIGNI